MSCRRHELCHLQRHCVVQLVLVLDSHDLELRISALTHKLVVLSDCSRRPLRSKERDIVLNFLKKIASAIGPSISPFNPSSRFGIPRWAALFASLLWTRGTPQPKTTMPLQMSSLLLNSLVFSFLLLSLLTQVSMSGLDRSDVKS